MDANDSYISKNIWADTVEAILKDKELFFKLVKDSFTQKRKTIRNNLKQYNLEKIEDVLRKYNFDLSVRAEQLPIEVFVDIANNL